MKEKSSRRYTLKSGDDGPVDFEEVGKLVKMYMPHLEKDFGKVKDFNLIFRYDRDTRQTLFHIIAIKD